MKRSKYLVPLSWEHHSALLNANRLQKGLANQTPKGILLDFLKYLWENDLSPHFNREETIVFSVKDWLKVPESLRNQVLQEHQEMTDLVEQIEATADENELKRLMGMIAQKVIDHVRFEERMLFPQIEKSFSTPALEKIEKDLKEAHVPGCVVWEPKFWEKK
ncbi:MAG: hemerythrin domain-containing protein [Caldisericaceae bacterium]|nr:hemerythrin domain-containing protein [Caldisericaceae bacterium]